MTKTFPAVLFFVVAAAVPAARQKSFDAVVSEARVALDTGRAVDAAGLFDEAAKIAPDRAAEIREDAAWAETMAGNAEIEAKQWANADRRFSRAAELNPQNKKLFGEQWVLARMYVLDDLLDKAWKEPKKADWKKVEDYAQSTIDIGAHGDVPHFRLGLAYEYQGRREDARREYKAVLGSEPVPAGITLEALRERARKAMLAKGFRYNLRPKNPAFAKVDPGEFQEYRKGRWVIYHHNKRLAEHVAALLDYYLSQPVLGKVISPGDPFVEECKVYIYVDKNDLARVGGGSAYAVGEAGGFSDGQMVWDTLRVCQTSSNLLEGALPHELTHLRFMAKYPQLQYVMWIQEGVAQEAEGDRRRRHASSDILAVHDKGKLAPAEKLLAANRFPRFADQTTVDALYSESIAMVDVLAKKGGKDGLVPFIDAVKQRPPAEAIKELYGLTPKDMDDLILAWAKENAPKK